MAITTAASMPTLGARPNGARLLTPAPVPQSGSDSEENSASASEGNSDNEQIQVPPKPQRAFVRPKVWMIVFGILLAACAGSVNVICKMGLEVFVSHVTGTVSTIGMRVAGDRGDDARLPWGVPKELVLVASFIFGAFLCGLVIPKNQLHFGGKSFYGVALLGNSILLVIVALISPAEKLKEHASLDMLPGCLAALACGLQNAMCTMHFGAVIRTTHVTGTATDIGSTLGRAVMILMRIGCNPKKGTDIERVELRDDIAKFSVLVSIMLGFLCGAIAGCFLHKWLGMYGLFFPAGFTGLSGIFYTFFRTTFKRQFKKWEQRRVAEEMQEIDEALQRAQTLIGQGGQVRAEDLGDLDELLNHSLAVAHDVESCLQEMAERSPKGADPRRSSTM